MEFNEKLQQLRKNKNMTQEELAAALFVSRAAVSKWESGRGYPSIDSLKDISCFFSVSIDDLLTGEKLLSLAENENKSNTRKMCDIIFGIVDLFSFLLLVLPLYPSTVDGYVYSISLSAYSETSSFNIAVYWSLFVFLILFGAAKLMFTKIKAEKSSKILTYVSLGTGIVAVIFLALAREAYALVLVFLMLIVKATVFIKSIKDNDKLNSR